AERLPQDAFNRRCQKGFAIPDGEQHGHPGGAEASLQYTRSVVLRSALARPRRDDPFPAERPAVCRRYRTLSFVAIRRAIGALAQAGRRRRVPRSRRGWPAALLDFLGPPSHRSITADGRRLLDLRAGLDVLLSAGGGGGGTGMARHPLLRPRRSGAVLHATS